MEELMEEEEGAVGGVPDIADIEQQFSCLRTEDKDELIKQLQKIVGPGLNTYAAQFFLDMNNWNLQLATNSYFDLIPSNSSPKGSTNAFNCEFESPFIELEAESGKSVDVLVNFCNNGDNNWPPGVSLRCGKGEGFYVVGVVEPSKPQSILIKLHDSPTESQWQMCTPEGYLFGQLLTIKIKLPIDAITQNFNRLLK